LFLNIAEKHFVFRVFFAFCDQNVTQKERGKKELPWTIPLPAARAIPNMNCMNNNNIFSTKCQVESLDTFLLPKKQSIEVNIEVLRLQYPFLPECGVNRDRNNACHVYVALKANGHFVQKAVYSLSALAKEIAAGGDWISLNSFFSPSYGRTASNVRWYNGLAIEFEGPDKYLNISKSQKQRLGPDEVLEYVHAAGLPEPTYLAYSPSGGIHCFWLFNKPIRYTAKVAKIIQQLQTGMAAETGADKQATGRERVWRPPTVQTLVDFQPANVYSLDDFITWAIINEIPVSNSEIVTSTQKQGHNSPQDKLKKNSEGVRTYLPKTGMLGQEAIQKLMRGVPENQRNEACFCISVAMFLSSYQTEQVIEYILHEWNPRNMPPAHPEKDGLIRTVLSASRVLTDRPWYAFAMAGKVKKLTGISLGIYITKAKPREERKRSHSSEWESDILIYLKKNGGQWEGSQRQLAQELNVPWQSFLTAISNLIAAGEISKNVVGRGRGAITEITMSQLEVEQVEVDNVIPLVKELIPNNECKKIMVQCGNINIFSGWVVLWGGRDDPFVESGAYQARQRQLAEGPNICWMLQILHLTIKVLPNQITNRTNLQIRERSALR
jgi:hypothetical protein